jgi:hypothetical protein
VFGRKTLIAANDLPAALRAALQAGRKERKEKRETQPQMNADLRR